MDRALRHRVRRIVWGSSVMVYGPPHAYPNGTVAEDAEPMPRTFYGATKLTLEWTARAFRVQGLETVGLRFTTVFGPGRERPGAAPFGVTLFESAAARRSIRLPEGDRKAAMQFYTPTPDEFKRWEDAGKAIWPKFQDKIDRKVFERVLSVQN